MKHNSDNTVALLFYCLFVLLLSCNEHNDKKSVNLKVQKTSVRSVNINEQDTSGNKIIGIKDGDTFVVLIDGKEQTVRLAHIDCPEKKQPFGNKAKQFASTLYFGKHVTLVHNNKFDRNKRLVAELILPDGSNVNKEMVKHGFAWHYKKYSDDDEYAQLEIAARANKTGLWSDPEPVAPWNWRKH